MNNFQRQVANAQTYSPYKRFKKKKKHKKHKRKKDPRIKYLKAKYGLRTLIDVYAKMHQINPPCSDQWFQDLWAKHNHKDKFDEYNQVFGKYIPDVLNHKYKYIIEVDGSWHDKETQKRKDEKKDQYYKLHGYVVYRIKAYQDKDLHDLGTMIKNYREKYGKPAYILRQRGKPLSGTQLIE